MDFKDYFSVQARDYAKYRPDYPQALYDFLLAHTAHRNTAWDCATGNGQVAIELAKHFDKIMATDASQSQLSAAVLHDRIAYSVAPAEQTNIPDSSIDLITVGQALHWFDFDAFYKEAVRVAAPDCLLAAFTYGNPEINYGELNQIIVHLYDNILGSYWPAERRYIDEMYTTIPFPFEQIAAPEMAIEKHWDLPTFVGYLSTWSSTQQYIKKHGSNPLELIQTDLITAWGKAEEKHLVRWPMAVKAALIK